MNEAGPAEQEIRALLRRYLDGLYHCDVGLLSEVLHPRALYATAVPEPALIWDMPSYFAVVAQRDPPARRGEPRDDELLRLSLIGPGTALAELRCRMGGKHYHDLLSLCRLDGRWWILSKVFHYELDDAGRA
ncbi:hypothetical protein HNQ51_003305 [Inhella inkyongensis]|uniref:Nuclear transport factor 2 family protein n=1 Tax=Inhella inkyongensis TaxID=392593 RepID=A0A840SB10_9BURK|nr:nuclear transport factor 2 family protein [Inhella inkyongensis]MBB5205974.1 hypothetical protein [Inhella inkyongensis]